MAFDMSSLRQAVRDRGADLHETAVDELEAILDAVVPDSDANPDADPSRQPGSVKLRDSREVTISTTGDVLTASVTYTADQANYTNEGTAPHPIDPKGDGVLAFYWATLGEIAFRHHVDHPGSHKHDGWFDRAMERWPEALAAAQSRLP